MLARLLKTIRRLAVAAFALAVPVLVLVPAAAHADGWSGPNSFGFQFGGGGGGGYIEFAPRPPAHIPYHPGCLSQNQVKRQLNDHGFTRVSFEDSNDDTYFVLAVADGWAYSLIVDCCTGELVDVRKLHRVGHDGCGCDDDYGPPFGKANGHFRLGFRLN